MVLNDSDATIDGDLTIKGVTRPITLQVRLVGAGINPRPPNKATVGFAATAAIKRSDFNISFGVPIISVVTAFWRRRILRAIESHQSTGTR